MAVPAMTGTPGHKDNNSTTIDTHVLNKEVEESKVLRIASENV